MLTTFYLQVIAVHQATRRQKVMKKAMTIKLFKLIICTFLPFHYHNFPFSLIVYPQILFKVISIVNSSSVLLLALLTYYYYYVQLTMPKSCLCIYFFYCYVLFGVIVTLALKTKTLRLCDSIT